MISLQYTQPQVPTNPGTTMVTYTPGTQVMTPVLAGISNGENNQSDGTPMICEIMASQAQPKEISNIEVEGNKALCLIDGDSNNGLVGAGIYLYEMTEHPEHVDTIGASDDAQDGMKILSISISCAVITSATGKYCLGVFHNYVGYCQ
eukprot:1692433-Ditylum_brightwellii.AAC.1